MSLTSIYPMNIKGNTFFTSFLIILISSMLLGSCSFNNLDQPDQIIDIRQEIEINLFQDLENTMNYKWLISTIESNLCKESELVTDYVVTQLRDKLLIQGLEIPNDCTSYASQISSVENLTLEEGLRNIEIYLTDNIVSQIQLDKEGNKIKIQSDDQSIVSLAHNNLQSISRNHFWGGLISPLEQNKVLFFNLFEELSEIVNYQQVVKGNYGYFTTDDQSIKTFDSQTFQSSNVAFAIKIDDSFEINKEEIAALVTSFRMTHPQIEFFISLGDGTQF